MRPERPKGGDLLDRDQKGLQHPPRLTTISILVVVVLTLFATFTTSFLDAEKSSPSPEFTTMLMSRVPETSWSDISTVETTTDKTTVASTTLNAPVSPTIVRPTAGSSEGMVVVIDPGHQSVPDYEMEPLYPGSAFMKAKCSAGTRGVVTRRYEYVVNLEISLKLKVLLEAQGVRVYLTRNGHDVRISNIERALFAEGKQADVFIRIHCNGSNDPTVQGVKTYVGETGIYAEQLPQWGQQLSSAIAATTGATDLGVDVSRRYTGLNWSENIPAFLLETGFMSNPDEDQKLSDAAYQDLICQGIADFVSQMPDL